MLGIIDVQSALNQIGRSLVPPLHPEWPEFTRKAMEHWGCTAVVAVVGNRVERPEQLSCVLVVAASQRLP